MNTKTRAEHLTIGKIGESIAQEYLRHKGYRIIAKNYRKPWGEIDLIAKSKDQTLVFFEIKTLRDRELSHPSIIPEDNLTNSKLKKLKKICESFANSNPQIINEKRGWQIDLLTLLLKNPENLNQPKLSLTEIEKYCEIKHYENI